MQNMGLLFFLQTQLTYLLCCLYKEWKKKKNSKQKIKFKVFHTLNKKKQQTVTLSLFSGFL